MRKSSLAFLVAATLISFSLSAAESTKSAGTLIELSAEASRTAPNDLAAAVVFTEATSTSPAELARDVNARVAGALQTARTAPAVKVRSGSTHTFPVYSKDGRIASWRMRSDLQLETRDSVALGELLGKLQTTMMVGQIVLRPAPETRRQVENDAALDAVSAFRARARAVADAFGKSFRIVRINIGQSGRPPVFPVARHAPMAAEAMPMPIEAGETAINVSVNGQIELIEN
ncbi:MAG: SIMPL domain-containing protein [Betaproteobacteria bacterium]|nr:SIMPL domain-containing protein [Betaproteobacteria bacterium]